MNLVMNHKFHLKRVLRKKKVIWIVKAAGQNSDATCTLALLESIKNKRHVQSYSFSANTESTRLLSVLDDALQFILSPGLTNVAADGWLWHPTKHLLPQLPARLTKNEQISASVSQSVFSSPPALHISSPLLSSHIPGPTHQLINKAFTSLKWVCPGMKNKMQA